jgi:hypothetical protein
MCGVRAIVACMAVTAVVAARGGRAVGQEQYTHGQNVAPAFEGWETNPDGSFNLVFGYFNRNYQEVLDVPIGPHNTIEPGGPDVGQPTRFFPRRSRFVFRVRVPKDFGNKEVVWTLTAHGKTEKAYATLKPEYIIDNRVIMMNNGGFGQRGNEADNKAPVVHVEDARERTLRVGQPLTLVAVTTDDGIPEQKTAVRDAGDGGPMLTIGGVRAGWIVYRSPVGAQVTFEPEQYNPEFRNARRNSPMMPRTPPPPLPTDGRVTTTATFDRPGPYVLRFISHDGALQSVEHVTVTVR